MWTNPGLQALTVLQGFIELDNLGAANRIASRRLFPSRIC